MYRTTYSIVLLVLFINILQCNAFVAWYKAKNLDFPTKCKVGYNVFKGETCESISEKFGIDLVDFKRMNSFPCEDLSPSDKVCIGGSYVKCDQWKLIEEGMTCTDFMREQQITEHEFKRLNPLVECEEELVTDPYLFFCIQGQVIKITYTM